MIPYAKQEYNLTDNKRPGVKCNDVGPNEFVSLIKNASFVLTDSFHGAVFSLIHHVPFAVFERNRASKVSMNSRLYDLLDVFGESRRLIDIDRINELNDLLSIDSAKINRIMKNKREESIIFLKSAIERGIAKCDSMTSEVTVSGEEFRCSGCGACIETCPKECISMKPNKNGFSVPVIDKRNCIKCGKCLKLCPMRGKNAGHDPIKIYGAHAYKAEKNCASGGISYVLSKQFVSDFGIAYGVIYDENLHVTSARFENVSSLNKSQGSKYVQADMAGIIEKVIADLEAGKRVLFTGTPCEIAGVQAVVRDHKLIDKLYTAEIICHGVPSPLMFKEYLMWAEEHYGKKIETYTFRAKDKESDKDFMVRLGFSDGSKCSISGFKDPYYKMFLSSKWLRESCYECPFADKKRIADITLGDFWNAEKLPREYGKLRRTSVVLVNTKKGLEMFDSIKKEIETVESTWEIAAAGNPNLYRPTRKSAGNKGYGEVGKTVFAEEYDKGIDKKKYIFNQLPSRLRISLKRIAHR